MRDHVDGEMVAGALHAHVTIGDEVTLRSQRGRDHRHAQQQAEKCIPGKSHDVLVRRFFGVP